MKPTLLIAEGDAELCDIYRMYFTECGYHVETATDGLDCLEKLRQKGPAVLILDRRLQRGGGSEGVLAWLREQRAEPGVPVVLTSTIGFPMDGPADIEPPVVNVLHKPFEVAALLESVRSAVARGQEAVRKAGQAPVLSELYLG
jgi:DNA-binding response OmpR family regulator